MPVDCSKCCTAVDTAALTAAESEAALIKLWKDKTPREAHSILREDDVMVTNGKAKEIHLPQWRILPSAQMPRALAGKKEKASAAAAAPEDDGDEGNESEEGDQDDNDADDDDDDILLLLGGF